MRILVTGAEGFTGKHFVHEAEQSGHTILKLTSNLLNYTELQKEIEQIPFDFAVHLAAISFVNHPNPTQIYEVNVIGTTNLLDAFLKSGKHIERILLASSANVYGNNNNLIIDENQPLFPINHYACSKVAMEYMAMNYMKKLPIFFVRPFNYIGPGQNISFVVSKIVSHFKNQAETIVLGDLCIEREFNDVRFVCQSYLKLLEKSKVGEIYNICTGKSYNLNFILSLLEKMTGHKIHINHDKSFFRDNEIKRLRGDPKKLFSVANIMNVYSLKDTLEFMLMDVNNSN